MKKFVILSLCVAFAVGAIIFTAADSEACCVFGPPDFSIVADPSILWPPNHKMVEIGLTVTCTANCDMGPTYFSWEVTDVQVLNTGPGEGSPKNDPDFEADGELLLLRAERSGKAGARKYIVEITGTYEVPGYDPVWKADYVEIGVPHNMGD